MCYNIKNIQSIYIRKDPIIMPKSIYERKTRLFSKNPIISSIYTADPSAHVWENGRIYIYASRDMDPSRGCDLMDHYHVFSSEAMAQR